MTDNVIVEVDDDKVTVSPVPGKTSEFREAAASLAKAGEVSTATGARGIVLVTDVATATTAGLVKKTRSTRKRSAE